MSRPLHLFLIAGEPSGDALGARLIAALRDRLDGRVRFSGVAGPRMVEQGMPSLFAMSDLTVMGVAEVVPHLRSLLRRMAETAAAIRADRPDALVTIDAPDFSFRIAGRVADLGIPRIHYVAPQVWAWRQNRAKRLAGRVDHLLALLPFEPAFFTPYGLDCRFVGHPVVESGVARGDGPAFRARHGVAPDAPVLLVLPGSRGGEVRRMLPIFRDAAIKIAAARPNLAIIVPTVPGVVAQVREQVAGWSRPAVVVDSVGERIDAFAAAAAALAASGTVTVELALAGVPTVVAYRVNALSAAIAYRLVRIDHVALGNIVLGRRLVPELLQADCEPDRLAAEVSSLLDDPARAAEQRAGFADLAARLGAGDTPPSYRAADAVLSIIAARGRAEA